MTQNQKQDTIKELIKVMKGDYKTPGKLFAWGLAIGQWMAIIIVGSVFFSILVYFIILSFEPNRSFEPKLTNTIHAIGEQGKIKAEQDLSAHLKEITEFMRVSAKSVNERQEIVERLTEEISLYAGRTLSPDELENKQRSFSSVFSTCTKYRGMYMDMFASNINPFDDPNISRAFDELVVGHFFIGRHVLDPQEENKRWEALCEFCRQEANKAKDELVQILKRDEGTSTMKKSEKSAVKTSTFK